ncbi:MAG TPA: DUF559 domain-containing protein [Jatrophihabitans sp.]
MRREPRILSRQQARDLGIADHAVDYRLRVGRWQRLLPGVYCTREQATPRDLVDAALLYSGPRSMLTGAAALRLYGLLDTWPDRLTVLGPHGQRRRSTRWLWISQTHRLPELRWLGSDAPRIAPVARAVADHCRTASRLDDVRAITGRAVQRRMCTLEELRNELEAGRRNGSALLRDALTDVEHGAWSAPEARAGRALRKAKVGPFEQNVELTTPGGRRYCVDFLQRALMAVLEIDSREHHFDEADWGRTMTRDRELEALGYSVIHVRPSELRDEHRFVADIREWLAGRAQSLR